MSVLFALQSVFHGRGLCCICCQDHWGFYIELDGSRAGSLFDVAHRAPDAVARTHQAKSIACRVLLAHLIMLAVQMRLSPDLTPHQWFLYQYRLPTDTLRRVVRATLNALTELQVETLACDVSDIITAETKAPLVVVLDEAQAFAQPGVRNCVSISASPHQVRSYFPLCHLCIRLL